MKRNLGPVLAILALLVALVALNLLFFVDSREVGESEQTADRSTYKSNEYGIQAYYSLLQESGYPVTRLEDPFTSLKDQKNLGTLILISLPEYYNPSEEEFKSLNKWVESGGFLIIIDQDISLDFGSEVKVLTSRSYSKAGNAPVPVQPTRLTEGIRQLALSEYASRISVDSTTTTVHAGDAHGAVLADCQYGEGRIAMLSDPFPVANNGISKADNVRLALNLVRDRPTGNIAFDEYHHGHRNSTLLGKASGGLMTYFGGTPVPWMTLQALLIAALLIYSRGKRFARPLPVRQERRTTNLEFVSSMANITRLARATDLAIQNIYGDFRKRLCIYAGLPVKTQTPPLVSAVARRAKMPEADLRQLLVKCDRASRGEQVSDSELVRMVTRIREIESALNL